MSATEYLFNEGRPGGARVVLAHGAGAPMDSPFMADLAEGLAAAGHDVVRFEFPYMRKRRETGRKSPPDRAGVLADVWRGVIADQLSEAGNAARLVIGGKSMGGRIASMVADEAGVGGLLCLGYPFHPPGRPEKTRIDHLKKLAAPALILQGTRDALGARTEVEGYRLSPSISLHWLEDGDHSFKPRKASGRTEAENMAEAIAAADSFLRRLIER